jgi:hypothetical protein
MVSALINWRSLGPDCLSSFVRAGPLSHRPRRPDPYHRPAAITAAKAFHNRETYRHLSTTLNVLDVTAAPLILKENQTLLQTAEIAIDRRTSVAPAA